MHQDVEEKFQKFIEEQIQLMEQEMGAFAIQNKLKFGDDDVAYFRWLNMAYQLKSAAPHLSDDQLTPESLKIPKF